MRAGRCVNPLERPHRQGSTSWPRKHPGERPAALQQNVPVNGRSAPGRANAQGRGPAARRGAAPGRGVCRPPGAIRAERPPGRKRLVARRKRRRSGLSSSCGRPVRAQSHERHRELRVAQEVRVWNATWHRRPKPGDPFADRPTRCLPSDRQIRRQARATPSARRVWSESVSDCEKSKRPCRLRHRALIWIVVRQQREAGVTSSTRAAANTTK